MDSANRETFGLVDTATICPSVLSGETYRQMGFLLGAVESDVDCVEAGVDAVTGGEQGVVGRV